jgi:hypothetical protein
MGGRGWLRMSIALSAAEFGIKAIKKRYFGDSHMTRIFGKGTVSLRCLL